ncbi:MULTISPECIES: glycosyltransferase family 2 protein [Sporomusa]|jgi:cellulose synthase/poly-beta-1,6-N-acetylglucosamine synthase-like glycosyltransferase|uniref:Beta-monoglucosyldiacylglycerol synthase n=2 Tax=Sporomusa TaxID=2375 RepID=A0ABM9W3J6_9FIRM|nr:MULTISPECIES: glycosyltransferase family 2 protein [Sporomusa]MCM0757163.1 glycosyltransferase [Sporomusa sphaeroides DSM 2875]OLS58554.1 beta-monoglucosyldiacylglycerol synthase [Sporomusa sphaeroides DSM 2875]CVK19694.1 Beta-monoglucosyldiacylglycerol synthase [Sporomusa sphaeroides DSM 2875]SCM80083.1 Glycosyl transferase, family 2 [uncultured Sporomusa sp.]HML34379.1 glycosyltransferase family 2 protein [Sporomusa sphaeroides]
MNYIFDYIMIPMQLIIVFFTLYYFFIAFFGIVKRHEEKILTPKHTFAVIVAAHNEEQVIGQLVENLHVLKYPRELYDIYVVADNCKDKTAHIAKNAGAIVYERFNSEQRGKGYAMEWMFEKLFEQPKQYDAVVVFDADNLVDTNFLLEMNSRLCKGEKVIQGYLDAKNPNDTWISGTFAISFWVVNHIWHLAKYNLGLSSVLGGTGMCISTDILKRFGWGATCLTEDMEFTMKTLLIGIRTTWAHDAIVYDEKPLTFMQSWKQRKRWAQGHFDVASRYIPKLITEGIKRRDIRLLDGVIHLVQPHFLLLSTTFVLLNYVYYITPFYTNILFMVLPIEVWRIIAIGQYLFPIIVLAKIRASWKTWVYSIFYPLFVYSWIPITFLGFLHRNDRSWSHTPHTRSLSYHEIILSNSNEFSKENLLSKQAIK